MFHPYTVDSQFYTNTCKKYMATNQFNSYEFEGVWYSIYSTKNSESPLIWNTATLYCKCNVYRVKPCRWACRPSSFMVSPCTRTCSTIMLYISSATDDLWPHPLHFFSPPIPLCIPLSGFIFQNTQSLVLLFISSWDSDLCVISFTTECSHMDCVLFVFILWFFR